MSGTSERSPKLAMLVAFLKDFPDLRKRIEPLIANNNSQQIYLAASMNGIVWDSDEKKWRKAKKLSGQTMAMRHAIAGGNAAPAPAVEQSSATPAPQESNNGAAVTVKQVKKDIVMVRVTAHRDVIERFVTDLTELAEMLNMRVLNVTDPTQTDESDEFQRCFVRMRKVYKGE